MHSLTKYLVVLIVLFQTFVHSVIIDDIVESGHQVGDAIDCGFRGVENIFGIGQNKPCRSNSGTNQQFGQENKINWNLGGQQENNGLDTPKQQSFGLWNLGKPSITEQNEKTTNIGQGFATDGNNFHNSVPEGNNEVVSTNVHQEVEASTQGTKTAPKLGKDNGRRIISARANCPPGFATDARGRCREIM
ncbi:hypothetical protein WA026_019128 [Henosepilachna vigintioctopunctata]|uniref:Uncharacterized protein n=1 Tax=Henosepilachna vigintioctopunctata TaxID=420089 RepID=A0AAW1UTM6_9CUCU